jgi:hypothetical protein
VIATVRRVVLDAYTRVAVSRNVVLKRSLDALPHCERAAHEVINNVCSATFDLRPYSDAPT